MSKYQVIFGQFYQPSTTAVFDTLIAKNIYEGSDLYTLSGISSSGNVIVSDTGTYEFYAGSDGSDFS